MKKLLLYPLTLLLIALATQSGKAQQQSLSISGYATAPLDTSYLREGVVFLYKVQGTSYTLFATQTLSATQSGSFAFTNVQPGKYIALAVMNGKDPLNGKYFPTYFGNTNTWESAEIMEISDTIPIPSMNIELQKYTNIIKGWRGKDTLVGNIYKESAASAVQRSLAETGVEAAVVNLYNNSGDRLTSTYTDPFGNYSFDGIGAGDFDIVVEFPGEGTQTTNVVTNGTGARVSVDPVLLNTFSKTVSEADIKLFPNPASDVLNLSLPEELTNADLKVISSSGQIIIESINPTTKSLSLSQLNPGLYILEFNYEGRIVRKRFSKI